MYIKTLLTVLVFLAASGCTIAGMDRIPGYEIIALAIGVGACFIMALGFAMTEKFHKQHLEEGTSRRRTWLFFSVVMVVFIFMLTCACSAHAFFCAGADELTPEDKVRVAQHQKKFVAPWQKPSAVFGTLDPDSDEPGWRKDSANKAINRDTYFVYSKASGLCFAVTFLGKGNAITATSVVPCGAVEKLLVNPVDYDMAAPSDDFKGDHYKAAPSSLSDHQCSHWRLPSPCGEKHELIGSECVENWDDSEWHYNAWMERKYELSLKLWSLDYNEWFRQNVSRQKTFYRLWR